MPITRLGDYDFFTPVGQGAYDGSVMTYKGFADVYYRSVPAFTIVDTVTPNPADIGTMTFRSGVLYWTDTNVSNDRPIYFGNPASPTLLTNISTPGGGSSSVAYNATDDRIYLFWSGSSVTDRPRLYRVHPTTGAHTQVATLQRFASPAVFPIVVTPDGAVWGLTYDYASGLGYTGLDRTVWWRWDGSLTEEPFPSGNEPFDEGFILVPQSDSTVLFVNWHDDLCYSLTAGGSITRNTALDPQTIDGNPYTFTVIQGLGHTSDCSQIVFGFQSFGGWFHLTFPASGWATGWL